MKPGPPANAGRGRWGCRRRRMLAWLGSLGLAGPGLAAPAGPARPWRIVGVTYRGPTEAERGFAEHFERRGIAVEIVWRDIALDTSRLPAVVDEIRRLRPDLVYTWGTGVTLGIAGRWDRVDPQRHITDIPIVFNLVAAPVGAGVVPALAGSGRKLTGVSHLASLEAQLDVMAAYRPLRRLGMLYTASEPNSQAVLEEMRAHARRRGFEVLAHPFEVDAAGRPGSAGVPATIARMRADGADWLYLPPDSYLNTQARRVVVPAALQAGLPPFASTEPLMAAGALVGLVGRYVNVGQFAAYKAEQILVQRRPPQQIPVETLSRLALQIRLPVARRLGLLPPLAMFDYAEMIQADVDVDVDGGAVGGGRQ